MNKPQHPFTHAYSVRLMKYLSKDELLDLHAYVITRYGGRLGIASQDRLATVLDAPRQVMFNAKLYPDVPSKAAAQSFLLLKSRPFVNGNQATALLALLRFLDINDTALRPEIGPTERLRVIRAIDQSEYSKEQFEAWLRESIADSET